VSSTYIARTVNLVDVNFIITVIIRFRQPPELLMTPHIPQPVHNGGRRRPWQMDTNFWHKAS